MPRRLQNDYLAALQETSLGLISRLDTNELLQDIISRFRKSATWT